MIMEIPKLITFRLKLERPPGRVQIAWCPQQLDVMVMSRNGKSCEGNPVVIGGFPSQRASNGEFWCSRVTPCNAPCWLIWGAITPMLRHCNVVLKCEYISVNYILYDEQYRSMLCRDNGLFHSCLIIKCHRNVSRSTVPLILKGPIVSQYHIKVLSICISICKVRHISAYWLTRLLCNGAQRYPLCQTITKSDNASLLSALAEESTPPVHLKFHGGETYTIESIDNTSVFLQMLSLWRTINREWW